RRCRCGLDFIISPGLTRWGAARKVSEEPLRFPADCPIRRIVTLARTDGSQGVPAYGAVLPRASRPGHSKLKSVALPTELPARRAAGLARSAGPVAGAATARRRAAAAPAPDTAKRPPASHRAGIGRFLH